MQKDYITGRFKLISLIIIAFLLGAIIGYSIGIAWALNWGVEKAMIFAEKQGINISLNSIMIANGLYQYKNNLGGCLFTDKNASLYSAKRN